MPSLITPLCSNCHWEIIPNPVYIVDLTHVCHRRSYIRRQSFPLDCFTANHKEENVKLLLRKLSYSYCNSKISKMCMKSTVTNKDKALAEAGFKKIKGEKIMMLLPTVVSAADSRHCRKIQQHKNSRVTLFMVKMSLFWLEQFIQYINSNFFVCWAIRKDCL